MKNQANIKLLFLLLFAVLLYPVFVSAQSITVMVGHVTDLILTIADAIVVVLWIVTGLLFLSAQGAPEKLNKARLALFAAIGGTAIIVIVQYIGIGGLIGNALQTGT